MKLLREMDEISRKRCEKCDYLNFNVPLNRKKPNCKGLDNLTNCDILLQTSRLEMRIKYLRGEMGPIFMCGSNGLHIETFEE